MRRDHSEALRMNNAMDRAAGVYAMVVEYGSPGRGLPAQPYLRPSKEAELPRSAAASVTRCAAPSRPRSSHDHHRGPRPGTDAGGDLRRPERLTRTSSRCCLAAASTTTSRTRSRRTTSRSANGPNTPTTRSRTATPGSARTDAHAAHLHRRAARRGGPRYSVAQAIASRIKVLLHETTLTITGWTCVQCSHENTVAMRDEDEQGRPKRHLISTYRISRKRADRCSTPFPLQRD
jgi:hypothetical protein